MTSSTSTVLLSTREDSTEASVSIETGDEVHKQHYFKTAPFELSTNNICNVIMNRQAPAKNRSFYANLNIVHG
jgi:hypothetical protein